MANGWRKYHLAPRVKLFLLIGLGHFAFWLLIDLVTHPDKFHLYFINEIWRGIFVTVVNYFFYERVLKRLAWRRPFYSAFNIIVQLLIFSLGAYMWRSLGINLHIFTPFKTYESVEHGIGDQFGSSLRVAIFFGVIRHLYDHYKLKRMAQQLRIEKQEAELSYLKSQTNPHFLFNTLNNIYSLSRDKSDLAPESILRLSKILRFMLYEAGGEYISIEQELKIIGDYIELEKLRYDETLHVNFNYDVDNMQQSIPPLLLIPLVENAFKHGVSETRNRPFVEVRLTVQFRRILFVVKNSVGEAPEEKAVKENIGLSNLKRQLELQYSDYELTTQRGESTFTATLKINLASHV